MAEQEQEKTARVVVVDDSPSLRRFLREVLDETSGFEVVGEAGNGAEGVEDCARLQPDLVLLDIAMPIMDGFEAIPRIRERSPASRIVVLSSQDPESAEPLARELGAHSFIHKDIPLPELIERLVAERDAA